MVFRPFVLAGEVVWLWARKPIVLLTLVVCGGALGARVVALRARPPAVDGPALPRAGWRATGYPSAGPPGAALDGDPQTGWGTRRGQSASDWFAVDMGRPQRFHQVVMDSGADADGYPRGYAVYVSGDGAHWQGPLARDEGTGPVTVAGVGSRVARYVKVVLTGQDRHHPWSLSEFTVH